MSTDVIQTTRTWEIRYDLGLLETPPQQRHSAELLIDTRSYSAG